MYALSIVMIIIMDLCVTRGDRPGKLEIYLTKFVFISSDQRIAKRISICSIRLLMRDSCGVDIGGEIRWAYN